jgi:hypothetical protein
MDTLRFSLTKCRKSNPFHRGSNVQKQTAASFSRAAFLFDFIFQKTRVRPDHMKTLILAQKAFALVGTDNFRGLSNAYTRADQQLMRSRTWTPRNPTLLTNQIKVILEQMDPTELNDEDADWRREILWFWYHHAISWAMWESEHNEFAKVLAQAFASMALSLQGPGHPNKITRLLFYLVHDDIETAEKWWALPPTNSECELFSGNELIKDYKAGTLFAH